MQYSPLSRIMCMQDTYKHTLMQTIDRDAIRVTEPQIIDNLDRTISRRRQLPFQNMKNETAQVEKAPTVLIRKIRDAIVDSVFKPGEWLPEVDLAKRFEVNPWAPSGASVPSTA